MTELSNIKEDETKVTDTDNEKNDQDSKNQVPGTKTTKKKSRKPRNRKRKTPKPSMTDEMEDFLYTGDTINHFEHNSVSYRMSPGKICSLPVDAPHVATLFKQGKLVEAPTTD